MTRPRSNHYKVLGAWAWNNQLLRSKVQEGSEDECWPWLGSKGPAGNLFGAVKLGRRQMTQANRLLFRSIYNVDCEDKEIRMTCGNRYCANWHHFEVTVNHTQFYRDGRPTLYGELIKTRNLLKLLELEHADNT